jgi:hypothetical protein
MIDGAKQEAPSEAGISSNNIKLHKIIFSLQSGYLKPYKCYIILKNNYKRKL